MTCRACHTDHNPRMSCETAKRLREAGVTNGVTMNDVVRNHNVTTTPVVCNHCVTKDAEIERLRNQIAEMTPKPAKRDRAEYMRGYRARPVVWATPE